MAMGRLAARIASLRLFLVLCTLVDVSAEIRAATLGAKSLRSFR